MTRNASAFLLTLLLCGLSVDAWAGRPVRVYEVELKGGQSPASVQAAMREVLIRATGRRDSATAPALASNISSAASFVLGYAKSLVSFDGAAVERASVAAGRGAGGPGRPGARGGL